MARKLYSFAWVVGILVERMDTALSEVFCMDSDDKFGMDDEIVSDGAIAFEPFDDDEGNIQ